MRGREGESAGSPPAPSLPPLSFWRALGVLPWRVTVLGIVVVLAGAAPAAFAMALATGAVPAASFAGFLGGHGALAMLASTLVVVVALVALVPPQSPSLGAYYVQLRDLARVTQRALDVARRRKAAYSEEDPNVPVHRP